MNGNNKQKTKKIRVIKDFVYAYKMMLGIYTAKCVGRKIMTVINSVSIFVIYTYLIRYIINAVEGDRETEEIVWHVCLIVAAVIAFAVIKQIYDTVIDPVLGQMGENKFRRKVYEKAMSLDLADFESSENYDIYTHAMTNGMSAVRKTLDFDNKILDSIITFALTVGLFWEINPYLTFFAALVFVIGIVNSLTNKIWYRFELNEEDTERKIDYVRRVFYMPEYVKERKLSNISRVMFGSFENAIEAFIQTEKKEGPKKAIAGFAIPILTDGFATLGAEVYALYCYLVSGNMLLGDCLVVLRSFGELTWASMRLGLIYSGMHDIAMHMNDFRSFIEKEPKIRSGSKAFPEEVTDVSFDNVSFKYAGAEKNVLNDISFQVHSGEKIAIVGRNGAGKTTLVKLLMRLYDVSAGSITVNGVDIRNYDLDLYRRQIGVVFQDYKFFALSIAENILGRPYSEKDRDTVEKALEQVGLLETVKSMPHGIGTVMGKEFDKDGAVLSQGQMQRIAIAAAYARDSRVIVLDEPSGALDPIAEQRIFEDMYRICEDKIVLFISHRMSSVVGADRVIVLDNGEVIETGRHEELMRKKGLYAELFNRQAKNYVSEGGLSDESC